MKKVFSSLLILIMSLFSLSVIAPVHALDCGSDGKCPTGYSAETDTDGKCTCKNMFGGSDVDAIGSSVGLGSTSLPMIIGNIVKAILGLFGVVATVIIVYGGVKWMTSQGDTQKIDSAKKVMIAGAIGMLLIVSGYAITTFLINNLLMKAVGA